MRACKLLLILLVALGCVFNTTPGLAAEASALLSKSGRCVFNTTPGLAAEANSLQSNLEGYTTRHEAGYCAMAGVCGSRSDGDDLPCASNVAATGPDPDLATQLQSVCPTLWAQHGGQGGKYCCSAKQVANIGRSTQKVAPFVIGCPACFHNFIHFWCVLSCSSDQATFTNVTAVNSSGDGLQVTEVDYWVDPDFGDHFFDSCKDVKFGAANTPAMSFIGGGAQNYQEWLDFLGLVKDKRRPPVGSPFQQNFLPGNSTPAGLAALSDGGMPTCGDNAYRCSCGDCPAAPGCAPDDDGNSTDDEQHGCHVGKASCLEFTIPFVWALLVALISIFFFSQRCSAWHPCEKTQDVGARAGKTTQGITPPLPTSTLLAPSMTMDRDVPASGAGGDVQRGGLVTDGLEPDPNPLTDRAVKYPWVERKLQGMYYKLGGGRPPAVETDPQRLWAAPSSQAAQEKAAFEASFGPFYRIEQLELTPGSCLLLVTTATLGYVRHPAEVMFAIQAEVDALVVTLQEGEQAGMNVSLTDICYKPFGEECATTSVLQYWAMDEELFEKEQAGGPPAVKMTPQYCFDHWYTECRAAFKGPMDPHLVLGGFPRNKEDFRNYTADATAFVVTYPVSSHLEVRSQATAWEKAFIQLAKGKLADLASAANLSISFVAERSVQDELTRESFTDASTVAASYAAMLLYIAIALGSLPNHSYFHAAEVLILSRVSLGVGGVLIVAASVAASLGIISLFGCWCTLIIMEVIPFLVLALGVDNMFVLAHALQRQDHLLPVTIKERVATALAVAGPSITLAAACEIVAFGLGAMTPMPAVTVLVSMLALDAQRIEKRRLDCLPCIRVPVSVPSMRRRSYVTVFVSMLALDAQRIEKRRLDCLPCIRVPVSVPSKRRRSYAGNDPDTEQLLSSF
eukprot:gene25325-10979_t